jgi:CheY-like chemotaxis protein/two-component sensor histidine kinase
MGEDPITPPTPAQSAAAGDVPAQPELLAMLGHELRNPLAPIRNSAALLRSLCSDPRQLQAVEIISRNVVHLTRMLDDLLDAARLRRGTFTLKKQNVDVAVIVHEVLQDVKPAIEARRQNLRISLPAAPVQMQSDPVRLAQILLNLLNNATRYTPDGGSISLSATVVENELLIEVADNGAGIDPKLLPQLFNVFAQAPQPLDRSRGGLGLGLAIARNLAEMHGGTLTVESAGPGQGSRFLLRLPIGNVAGNPSEVAVPHPDNRPASVASRRVLIIEDNPDIALSLSLALTEFGYSTITAPNGERGLEVAEQFVPEVVLVDVGLPGMDGFDTALRLRQLPELTNLLVLALSGYDPQLFPEGSAEVVFDHYFTKPVEPNAVLAFINSSLAKEPQ